MGIWTQSDNCATLHWLTLYWLIFNVLTDLTNLISNIAAEHKPATSATTNDDLI